MKLIESVQKDSAHIGFIARCPGCDELHVIYTNYPKHPNWMFDGNFLAPTFTPSLLVRYPDGFGQYEARCHSFITAGHWHFLGDCTHHLAGQVVPMVDLDNDE